MKKQVGILVAILVAAQMTFAAVGRVEIRDIEARSMKIENVVRSAKDAKTLADAQEIKDLEKSLGLKADKIANDLKTDSNLAKTYVFISEVLSQGGNADALQKRVAEVGLDILNGTGLKNVGETMTDAERKEAAKEAPAVRKFKSLIPALSSYGEKAVRLAEEMDNGMKAGLKSNKALRAAAKRVLGLDGQALEDFMKDQEKGLGGCKE
jgi:hypothetical protein